MAPKKTVAVFYDKSFLSTEKVDFVDFIEFLNNLNQDISCVGTCTEDSSSDNLPSEIWKAVVFAEDAAKAIDVIGAVRQKSDAEEDVKLKLFTFGGNVKLDALREMVKEEDFIKTERIEMFADWFPKLLLFLFEMPAKPKPTKKEAVMFIFDDSNEIEMEWYNRTRSTLTEMGMTCLWHGCQEDWDNDENKSEIITHFIIASIGDGEMMLQHLGVFMDLVRGSKALVLTDNPGSKTVKFIKSSIKTKVYEVDPLLNLDYRSWSSFLKRLGLVNCKDVMSKSKALKVLITIGLVLAYIIIGIPLFILWIACWIICPALMENRHNRQTNPV